MDRNTSNPDAFLEHFPEAGGLLQRVALAHFPFRMGREANADLVVYSPRVSKMHASIVRQGEEFYLQDLGSTNGTFVNGGRVAASARLTDGDIILLANKELRFGRDHPVSPYLDNTVAAASRSHPGRSLFKDADHLTALIGEGHVQAFFQPLLSLVDGTTAGYEALGRGLHPHLPGSPGPLFSLAQECRLAVPLSRAFRTIALRQAERLPPADLLFLNVHPEEMHLGGLSDLLATLPRATPGRQVVMEVHEDVVADRSHLDVIARELRDRGLKLAYDDFGAGQARLTALVQVPPDFVKLDRGLVQELPTSPAMRELVLTLARVCADLNARVVAEGVETIEQANICRDLGCELVQGYLFATPQPVEAFILPK